MLAARPQGFLPPVAPRTAGGKLDLAEIDRYLEGLGKLQGAVTRRTGLRPRQVLLGWCSWGPSSWPSCGPRTVAEGACTALRRHLPELTGMEVGSSGGAPSIRSRRRSGCAASRCIRRVAGGPCWRWSPPVSGWAGCTFPAGLTLESIRLDGRACTSISPPAARGDRDGVCPLALLERLEIGRLQMHNARVDATLPGARLGLDGVDLAWRTRRGAIEIELRAARGALSPPGRGEALAVHQFVAQAALRLGEETLEIARAEVGVDEALISLSGKLEALCNPSAELEAQVYLPLATVGRATGSRLPMSGHTWTRWSINGPLDAADIRGALDGHALQLGPYTPGEVSGRLALRGRTLSFETCSRSWAPVA